ncbi:hypothetical protein CG51_09040 [Haematobacter missouriensis]|uniref:Uncharacterized protein n=1 Tax=Haematobacter missouriensis TaxID=366616 RepID=A0A212AVL8_9RHOB|nr:hypothetical protein [Haematobacter missouriensis]KFI33571.1 hypothetical protein CG51_09040 [Haematobacter missouriensis]OWJ79238.1 hypothetical protein CDV53_01630 [Haematobacter missouriensis]OWJ85511.1 hypothetical protein CDV52_03850 [Haematobacter missouriensis]
MILRFADSHAYPGCRVGLAEAGGDTLAEFSDGSTAPVVAERQGTGWDIRIAPYRTARGTAIAAANWRLSRVGDGWKVTARLGG